MKKLLLPLILLFATYCVGQNSSNNISLGKPLPDWVVSTTPTPQNDTYYYKVFKGTGATELDARNLAAVQAFQQADAFTGTRVNTSDIYKALEKGTSIEVMSSTFSIPIYIACETSKKMKDGNWNYWLLCQIATRGNITPSFDTQFNECNKHDYWDNEIVPKLIKEQKARAKDTEREAKKQVRESNPYLQRQRNNYVAWGIAGTGYPWNLYSSIEFRYGKTVGIGAYLDLGLDFTHITVNQKYTCTKTMFGYAAGIKFFPYRGLFLSCGYGSIPTPSKSVTLDLSDWQIEHGSTDEMIDKAQKKAACDKVQQNNGLLVHAGYDLVTDLTSHAGFFLGINAGVSFDFANKVIAPSALIKFGVAWKY